ncbi:Cytochrome P450 67 [Diplodia seriata]|uniref:Cytochrome P450 67 n=1 Tax=Diplodia seriata TaxID=420778 RepID=A0A1S8B3G2_9PEZI|nr:Cytochrome P450 67 [Diplodia seriata]
MVSMKDHHSHSVRKRMVSNIYSNSTLLSSPALENITQTILNERFIPALRSAIAGSKDVDAYSLFGGTSMDIVTGYIFGLPSSTDFTTDETERRRFHDLYFSRRGPDFWLQFPGLVRLLRQIGIKLIPDRFVAATLEIEAFVMAMCDKAAARISATSTTEPLEGVPPPPPPPTPPSHHPTVYAPLSAALTAQAALTDTPAAPEATRLALASECMDHVVAGYETSTVTLTYLCWHLSRQPSIQHALRREIQGIVAKTPASSSSSAAGAFTVPSPRALTSLPLLHACVTETLRLHAGAPGPQWRVTPAVPGGGGVALGPPGTKGCYAGIPGGVWVAASPWCVHRNEEVFPDAGEWRPGRWLEDQGAGGAGEKEEGDEEGEAGARAREMGRWFWAFGSGGRVCVGSHLALYQIKHVIAALYANFETEIVDDGGIEQEDHFLAHPKGHRLILRLKEVDARE